MNRREDFLEPYRTYLGIPFRDEMLPPILDDLNSAELDINSESISDIDIPGLDTDVGDIEGYFSGGNLINDVINARIDTSSKYILSDFNFGTTDYAGGLKAGDITWNTGTGAVTGGSGIVINRAGIIGAKAGSAKFSIDTNGDATFAGDLSAATGTLGTLTIASGGHIKQGQTAYDTGTGFWLGDDSGTTKFSIGNNSADKLTWDGSTLSIKGNLTIDGGSGVSNLSDAGSLATQNSISDSDCDTTIISGGKIITGLMTASNIQTGTLDANAITVSNLTVSDVTDAGALASLNNVGTSQINSTVISGGKIVTGLLTANNIQAGTLTGRTVIAKGSGSGADLRLDSGDGQLKWLYDGTTEAYAYCDSSGNLLIDGDQLVKLVADGTDDWIGFYADDMIYSSADRFQMSLDSDFQIDQADSHILNYNSDQSNAEARWDETGQGTRMSLDDGGNLWVHGSVSADNVDFAELFEAIPKCAKKKIPTGTTVVLEEGKIRPAKSGEIPIGVISATASIKLGVSKEEWHEKYLRNELGEKIYEDYEFWSTRKNKRKIPRDKEGRVDFKKYEEGRIGWSMYEKPPKGANVKMVKKPKLNPKYNPNKKYLSREKRPEWNVVGIIGQVKIRKGQPVDPRWIKMKDISNNVAKYLIK